MDAKSSTPLTWRNYSGVAAAFGLRAALTLLVGSCACVFISLMLDVLVGRFPPGGPDHWAAPIERLFPTLLAGCYYLTLFVAGVQAAIAVWALLAARVTERRNRAAGTEL